MNASMKRAVFESLKRSVLLGWLDAYQLEVPDRRVRAAIVDALVESDLVELPDVLDVLELDQLEGVCRELGLDETGREKGPLIERILGAEGLRQPAAPLGASATGSLDGADVIRDAATVAVPAKRKSKAKAEERTGSLGFEEKLWDSAKLLRNNMDPAEYKHVVLGLLFLKYIEDAFEERREAIRAAVADPKSDLYVEEDQREEELSGLLEDRDEYTAENVFWVPEKARWGYIKAQAKQPTIGRTIDEAMDAIEKENPKLKGVLPKIFAMPNVNKQNLGKLMTW